MKIITDVLETKTLEDLQLPKREEADEPILTTEKVEEAISLLKDIENNNGYLAIAGNVKLTMKQIKEIHLAMKERIVELTPVVKTEEVI